MATQAGWYNAPGEPGLLRYWSGEAWTEHRQPVPASVPVVEAPALVAVASPASRPDAGEDPYGSSSAAAWSPSSSSPTQPSHFQTGAGVGVNLSIDGIPVGALTHLPDLTEVTQALASASRQARVNAATQPRSTALTGAVKGMVTGLVIIVLGVALVLFFSAQNSVHAGEVKTSGTVSSHSGFGSSCVPVVEFTVDGTTYRASDGTGGSCTSDFVGSSVDVIYSAADPEHSGRYDFGNPIESFDILLPVLGIVIFVSSAAAFVVRLFRRRSQFAPGAIAP